MKLQNIISSIQSYHPNPDLDLIRNAYSFVLEKHKGQTRASGEPYVTHVTNVAYLASQLKLDDTAIVTALLHDTVEDTNTDLDEISLKFSPTVAELVDGVTKLSQIKFSSKEEAQAENFRKMLLAMSKDIRVILIKLCDRTHNMRTLQFLSESRQIRIAKETLDIYAPLAHRLGIYWMKSELEDLSLSYLKTDAYKNIEKQISVTKKERDQYITKVVNLINQELAQNNTQGEVTGRSKSFYSIFQKMQKRGLDFNEIFDLIAFRIIVSTIMDCYTVLGIIHAAWKPIPGRFKDYIAMPKPNDYQSLHTTVIGPQGHRVEIQIRTQEMHEIAETGIASHWLYKAEEKTARQRKASFQNLQWVKSLLESEKSNADPYEFMSNIKDELHEEEVFVFTPKGDVIALPQGATPIDFAFHIHSELGFHCSASRVNGQQVQLNYLLKNGDTVEVSTSKTQVPNKDWLNSVVTTKAKQRIRNWIKSVERVKSVSVGKELLSKDLKKVKLSYNKILKSGQLQTSAEELGLGDVEILLADVGYGKISTTKVLKKLLPEEQRIDEKLKEDDSALQKIFKKAANVFKDKSGIKVSGLDNVVFSFARCCDPLPGNELVGYVTRGRGVTVHTRNCHQTLKFDPRRLVAVTWDNTIKTTRKIQIKVHVQDKVGMLANLTHSISEIDVNIVSVNVKSSEDGKAVLIFDLDLSSTDQLSKVIRAIEKVDGVIRVERTKH